MWLFDERNEEIMKEQWLHTQMTQSFNDFKKQQMSASGVTKTKVPTKEEQ
nr:MAG TPA: hypothetical protein [Caudoviricetes sp.]